MEQTNKNTWMPTVAGVLNIVTGVFNLIGIVGLIIAIAVVRLEPAYNFDYDFTKELVIAILVGVTVFLAVTGILALVGGIFALMKKGWGVVLAGSIAAIITQPYFGIPAVIFAIMGRKEFSS